MKFISLRSFLAMIFLLAAGNLHAQGSCMVLYDNFWNCSQSFMANTPYCNEANARWSASDCTANICHVFTKDGGPPPQYLNCGVNQERYDLCMGQGFGKGRSYATQEQYCTGWAGPAR
jgi:hypothetical protein